MACREASNEMPYTYWMHKIQDGFFFLITCVLIDSSKGSLLRAFLGLRNRASALSVEWQVSLGIAFDIHRPCSLSNFPVHTSSEYLASIF